MRSIRCSRSVVGNAPTSQCFSLKPTVSIYERTPTDRVAEVDRSQIVAGGMHAAVEIHDAPRVWSAMFSRKIRCSFRDVDVLETWRWKNEGPPAACSARVEDGDLVRCPVVVARAHGWNGTSARGTPPRPGRISTLAIVCFNSAISTRAGRPQPRAFWGHRAAGPSAPVRARIAPAVVANDQMDRQSSGIRSVQCG